jgi:16S rRNA (adenine1518-N6/adenine1519-N6)-dimethyltransferase
LKVKPKKYLGQHFLKDNSIAQKIVEAYFEIPSDSFLIEVGPGMGVLTDFILNKNEKGFIALDVDEESVDFLKKKYPENSDNFRLMDFLNTDFAQLTKGKWNVIGNFPYNISSQILFKVLEYRKQVDVLVGMFQKEVGIRICANAGSKDYGILSVLVQAFYEADYLFTVQPGSFNPPPKVKSGVIRLIKKADINLNCNENLFFKVVKTAFNQRRKMLSNALKPLIGETNLQSNLLSKRAEQLSVHDFTELTSMIEKVMNEKNLK